LLPEGDKQQEWETPNTSWALAVSPDGTQLAVDEGDNSITLRNVKTGEKLHTFIGHSDSVGGLAFSPNGEQLASASYDDTARLWNVKTGESLHVLKSHTYIDSITFSSNGELLATSSDNNITLWNANSWRAIRVLQGHQNMVFGLRFITDGVQLVSASFDRTLRVWDTESGVTMRVLQGHEAGLTGIATHAGQIFSASNDGTVRRWDMALPNQHVVDLPESAIYTAIAPDGNSVVVGFADGALRLYSLLDNSLLWEQEEAHTDLIARIAFNAEGNLLYLLLRVLITQLNYGKCNRTNYKHNKPSLDTKIVSTLLLSLPIVDSSPLPVMMDKLVYLQ
jgi:WD40 repeat protein